MTTQQSPSGEWYTQLGTWLGIVAMALALYALLRDNPNTRRTDTSVDTQTAEIQLRDAIVKLQESSGRNTTNTGERASAARAWLYFQSVQQILARKKVTPTLAGCLVLANFSFSHADVSQGNRFLTLASAEVKKEDSPVTQCLARAAMAHFMFEHTPTTPLAEGRERFAEAVAESKKLSGQGAAFVQLSILQEWALDEYSAGEETAGDEQHAAAIELLGNEAFSPAYRSTWEQEMDRSIIEAKVRGRLL